MNFPFHRVGVDSGVAIHNDLENLVFPAMSGAVRGYSHINSEKISEKVDKNITDYYQRRRFAESLVVKSSLATISEPKFPKTWKKSSGQVVLNGASGDRALNYYRSETGNIKIADRIYTDVFNKNIVDISEVKSSECEGREFSIEIKNLSNFYHFLIESLQQLTLVPDNASVVNVVSRDEDPKLFSKKWIAQLFPELTDKIRFVHPRDADEAIGDSTLTPLSGKHLLYQVTGSHVDLVNERAPMDTWWTGYNSGKHHVATLGLNSYDSSLLAFQQMALNRVAEEGCVSNLSRVYIARKPGLSRDRKMKNEDKLIAALEELGFVKIYLEDLEPLEQIALMNSADCVVMQHGAGMANMIFGNPYTHFIEIGTAQTALRRWGDFIPLTHVSQCHYHAVFVDMDFPEEQGIPAFANHGLVSPVLTDSSIKKIVELAEHCIRETVPGSVAGLEYHAEQLQGSQPDSMVWKLIEEQNPMHDVDKKRYALG